MEVAMALILTDGPEERQDGLMRSLRAKGGQPTVPRAATEAEAVAVSDEAIRSGEWMAHWLDRIEERARQIRRGR
jgi:hypothetical protein